MSSRIWIRRAYEAPSAVDGHRVLVDRLWPRGVTKSELNVDQWTRHIAPSDGLRRWFGHEPGRWSEFRTRYRDELGALTGDAAAEFAELVDRARRGRVTLVYAARDTQHNDAVVLREVIEELVAAQSGRAQRSR